MFYADIKTWYSIFMIYLVLKDPEADSNESDNRDNHIQNAHHCFLSKSWYFDSASSWGTHHALKKESEFSAKTQVSEIGLCMIRGMSKNEKKE